MCCFKACLHRLCTTVHHHGVSGAATVPCWYRGVSVVRPRHAQCECWSPTRWSASGSAPLESRLLNLDSTLQQIKPLAFWQYLTLRVVCYVLHICAPQAGYMPQYSSVAVIFVDQSLFFYWREYSLITDPPNLRLGDKQASSRLTSAHCRLWTEVSCSLLMSLRRQLNVSDFSSSVADVIVNPLLQSQRPPGCACLKPCDLSCSLSDGLAQGAGIC